MFQWVICTCEGQNYKISYKYERCKQTKPKACYKNISCSFICSFIVLIFSSYVAISNFDWKFFIQLIWWNGTPYNFKKFYQTKMFQILLNTLSNLFDLANLIKLIWLCINTNLSIVDWFNQLCVTFFFLKICIWFCRM